MRAELGDDAREDVVEEALRLGYDEDAVLDRHWPTPAPVDLAVEVVERRVDLRVINAVCGEGWPWCAAQGRGEARP